MEKRRVIGEDEAPILNTHPTVAEGEIGEEILEKAVRVVEMVVTEVLELPFASEVPLHPSMNTIPSSLGLPMPTKPLTKVLATDKPFALALVKGIVLSTPIPEGLSQIPDVGTFAPHIIRIYYMLRVKK